MNWLVLSYFLMAGTVNYDVGFLGTGAYRTPAQTYETTLGVEATIADFAFVGGQVQTWETPAGGAFFTPLQSLYQFNAGFRFHGFELGFRHECDHMTLDAYLGAGKGFIGDRTEFYLSYTGKLKVF